MQGFFIPVLFLKGCDYLGFIDFLAYIKHLGEKALVFFPSKTDLISVTDKDGNPTEELLSERLETINNTYATTAFVKKQIESLNNSDSLVLDILNVFKKEKENRIFKLIYPRNMSESGYDSICTSLYPNVGDYFYSSGKEYVSYAGHKVTLDKGWYKIKTDLTLLDPIHINIKGVYPYPLFCHPVVANGMDGFEDPEFITAEENGINMIVQEEERLGNTLFSKEYELKDALECVKEENQYLGESDYWCPGLIEGKAIPKGSIWYVNDDADTNIGYYQAKIDIVSTFTYNISCRLSPPPDPYEKFYFEYLGTSYKVYAGMPNSDYKQVQRDSMLEEIRKILENHIK